MKRASWSVHTAEKAGQVKQISQTVLKDSTLSSLSSLPWQKVASDLFGVELSSCSSLDITRLEQTTSNCVMCSFWST